MSAGEAGFARLMPSSPTPSHTIWLCPLLFSHRPRQSCEQGYSLPTSKLLGNFAAVPDACASSLGGCWLDFQAPAVFFFFLRKVLWAQYMGEQESGELSLVLSVFLCQLHWTSDLPFQMYCLPPLYTCYVVKGTDFSQCVVEASCWCVARFEISPDIHHCLN